MKTVLTLIFASVLFSSIPRPEPYFLSFQDNKTKAEYQDEILNLYPKDFVKTLHIVKVSKDITAPLRLPGISRDLHFSHQKHHRLAVDKIFGDQCLYWEGTFSNEDKYSGHRLLKIQKYPDVLSGRFWIDDKTFLLDPINEKFAALIEVGTVQNSDCSLPEAGKKANAKSSSQCTPLCSGGVERIRFVIDSELQQRMSMFLSVYFQVVWSRVIAQITMENSLQAPIYVSNASVLNFNNTSSMASDVNSFNIWKNSNLPTVDKAVLLTSHDYSLPNGDAIYGRANGIPGNVAIVEILPGHPEWLSAHEIGHLYGGRHNNDSTSSCARAYKSGSIGTPLVTGMIPFMRQNYYSDPATYGSIFNWNAGVIQNNWCGS